jgi:hypothetical protein
MTHLTIKSKVNIQEQPSTSYIPYFDDRNRRSAAYIVAAVAVAAFATFAGNGLVTLWVGGTSLIFLARDLTLTYQDLRHSGLENSSQKVFKLAQRIFVYGLIWGVLLTGMSIALTVQGSTVLLEGVIYKEPFMLLQALNNFTGVAALWAPISQFILNKSDRFFYNSKTGREELAVPIRRWIEAILESIQKLSPQPLWNQMAVDSNYLSYLPPNMQKENIREQIKKLDDKQINSLIDRFPYLLSIEFLRKNLRPEQFEAIVKPRLKLPFIDLTKMNDQLILLEKDIPLLQTELRDARRHKHLYRNKLHWYSTILSQYENCIKSVAAWQIKLPADRKGLGFFGTDLDRLADAVVRAGVEKRIATLRQLLNDPEDDLKLKLKEAAGFSEADFKALMNLFPYDKPLNLLLAERGLRTLRDLQFFGIIEGRTNNTAAEVIVRLRNYLNEPKIPTVQEMPATGRLHMVPWETIAHRVGVLANYVFYYGFTVSLLGLQYFYFPVATTAGLGYGLLRANRFNSLEKLMSWETVPDFTGQTVNQRCRFIWQRTTATLLALKFGAPTAFLTGIYLADTLRHYAGPHLTRLKNRISPVPATAL